MTLGFGSHQSTQILMNLAILSELLGLFSLFLAKPVTVQLVKDEVHELNLNHLPKTMARTDYDLPK